MELEDLDERAERRRCRGRKVKSKGVELEERACWAQGTGGTRRKVKSKGVELEGERHETDADTVCLGRKVKSKGVELEADRPEPHLRRPRVARSNRRVWNWRW